MTDFVTPSQSIKHASVAMNDHHDKSHYTQEERDLMITFEDEPHLTWDKESFQELLKWGVEHKMSDLIVSSNEPIWMSRLGVKIPVTERILSTNEIDRLIEMTSRSNTVAAGLKSGREKNYAYEFRVDRETSHRFRVNATATTNHNETGSAMTMRHLPHRPPLLADLNIEPDLQASLEPKDGLVLVTGNTGTGKTTLLAAIIRNILSKPFKSVVTYEDPVEFIFKDLPERKSLVDHQQIGENLLNWENAAPNANRRDPEIVFLGEAKEKETFAGLIDLSNIGKACYASLHTSRPRMVLPRILDKFDISERAQMGSTLIMNLRVLISQRLLLHKDRKRRVAIREYLVLRNRHRNEMIRTPLEEIPVLIDDMIAETGNSFLNAAKKQFQAGNISQESLGLIEDEMA